MLKSDSVSIRGTYALAENDWLNPWLWTGAVRTHGAPSVALVSSFEEVAQALIDYAQVGVTHILSGWPEREEMIRFGNEVLPRVRQLESGIFPQDVTPQPAGRDVMPTKRGLPGTHFAGNQSSPEKGPAYLASFQSCHA